MWNCRMGDLKEYLKILGICYSYNQNLQIEKIFLRTIENMEEENVENEKFET